MIPEIIRNTVFIGCGSFIGGAARYLISVAMKTMSVKGKVDFPQIGLEKGTTERGIPKVSKSC